MIPNWIGMGQEAASVIAQRKEANRIRQQEYRDRKAPKLKDPKPEEVTTDVTRYVGQETTVTEDSDRDRRQASDSSTSGSKKPRAIWKTAVPGQPGMVA